MHSTPCCPRAAHNSRPCLAAVFIIVVLLTSLPGLRAQDIMVGEPVLLLPAAPPDEPPQVKRLKPVYPSDMRKTDETGYVIITRYVDAKGVSRLLDTHGTHAPFERAVEDEYQDWKMTPARQGGAFVDSLVWLPVIFNPKSADSKSADARPRLLAVTPVITNVRPTAKGLPPVVRVKLSLDATGIITRAEPEDREVDPAALAAIRESLRAWRFAPARTAGKPVAAEMIISVICQPAPKINLAQQVPPKPVRQAPPHYPEAMLRFGLEGVVVLNFAIDTDGSVKDPTVARSDNPAFDEPAIEAVLGWRYEPATSDGKPIKRTMRQEIRFQLNNGRGQEAFFIMGREDQAKLPEEMRYDTPPKIRSVQLPVYPFELKRAEVTGHARVAMLVDPQGRVIQVKVTEADRPEFGLALTAAVEDFRFDPALKAGRPVPHVLAFEQEFSDRELPDEKADRLLSLEKRHPERIVPAGALDEPLKPLSLRPPIFPITAGTDRGRATIEFLVDENGRARLARIVEAAVPAFGYAAVQAVDGWWFGPPHKGGKPVVARAQVPVEFSPPGKKPADDK